jgi:hypothetical protein
LDDEVRFHLEMQIEDNLEAGMNPQRRDMPHSEALEV